MKRNGKRFLVLLTTASLSLNMLGISAFAAEDSPETDAAFVSEISKNETDLSVNRPDSEVPEVSYEPIIIDIPDGPIPAGETWDNEVSATDIAENDIPTTDSFKVHLSGGSSKLWITAGGCLRCRRDFHCHVPERQREPVKTINARSFFERASFRLTGRA